MYNAIQKKNPIKINVRGIVNACWNAWDLGLENHEDVVLVWNIILDANNVDRNHLVGWEQEYLMPYFHKDIINDFQYGTQEEYEDTCNDNVFSELLNSMLSEPEWKTKFTNYLTWVGYTQQ